VRKYIQNDNSYPDLTSK